MGDDGFLYVALYGMAEIQRVAQEERSPHDGLEGRQGRCSF